MVPRPPTVDPGRMCAWGQPSFSPPDQALPRLAEDPGPVHTVYLRRCGLEGCTIQPGSNNAVYDTSSLVQATSVVSAFTQGDEVWSRVVACVRLRLLTFDLAVVDADPGAMPHYEVVLGGQPGELAGPPLPPDTGGVAPGVCEPTAGLAFVFDVWGDSVEGLCYATVHELGHLIGLDHELLPRDPMSYLGGRYFATVYQNERAECGEDEGQDRDCGCERLSQNSFREVLDQVGPTPRAPSRVHIIQPGETAYLTGPAALVATAEPGYDEAFLYIDGVAVGVIDLAAPPPLSLRPGMHVVEVRALYNNRTELDRDRIVVNMGPSCGEPGDCGFGLVCLQDECVDGPDVPGGLGALCAADNECMTGLCSSRGACTALCGADTDCPVDFYCQEDGAGLGECLYGERPSTGGCASSGGGGGVLLLLALAAIVTATWPRRCSRSVT